MTSARPSSKTVWAGSILPRSAVSQIGVPSQIGAPVFLKPVAMIVLRPRGAIFEGLACRIMVASRSVAEGGVRLQYAESNKMAITARRYAGHRGRNEEAGPMSR